MGKKFGPKTFTKIDDSIIFILSLRHSKSKHHKKGRKRICGTIKRSLIRLSKKKVRKIGGNFISDQLNWGCSTAWSMERKSRLISHFSERKRFFPTVKDDSAFFYSPHFLQLSLAGESSLFHSSSWTTIPSYSDKLSRLFLITYSTFSFNNIIYELFHLERTTKKKKDSKGRNELINQSSQILSYLISRILTSALLSPSLKMFSFTKSLHQSEEERKKFTRENIHRYLLHDKQNHNSSQWDERLYKCVDTDRYMHKTYKRRRKKKKVKKTGAHEKDTRVKVKEKYEKIAPHVSKLTRRRSPPHNLSYSALMATWRCVSDSNTPYMRCVLFLANANMRTSEHVA